MMHGIGVMSGSSLDGIDLAYVVFQDTPNVSWKLVHSKEIAIPDDLRNSLSGIVADKASEIAVTNARYSKFLAESIATFIQSNKLKPDFVAIHGHTIVHYPEYSISWQLLNGGYISGQCNLPVVCDFRNQDMSLGGQGTPMAVLVDRDLFPGYDYYVNLGGIANVSISGQQWRAFDICPCNQVFNFFARRLGRDYDENGNLAREGTIHHNLVASLLNDEYILRGDPKSIDNSWVSDYWIPKILSFNDSDINYLRSYIEFVAVCLSHTFSQASAKILISGGGANNLYLMDVLKDKMTGLKSEIHIPSIEIVNFKEAILIAYAGMLRLQAKANFVATATGARHNAIGGAVYLPPILNQDS